MWEEYIAELMTSQSVCVCGHAFPPTSSRNRRRTLLMHCRTCDRALAAVVQMLVDRRQYRTIVLLTHEPGMSDHAAALIQEAQKWALRQLGLQSTSRTAAQQLVVHGSAANTEATVQDTQQQSPAPWLPPTTCTAQVQPPSRPAAGADIERTANDALEVAVHQQYPQVISPVLSSTDDEGPVHAPRRNTVAGIMQRMDTPGYHVADLRGRGGQVDGMQVQEFIIKYLEWKQSFNITDSAGNELLRFISGDLLRFEHGYPHSWHLIRQLVQPENDLQYQHVMCLCQNHHWPPIPDDCNVEVQVFADVLAFDKEVGRLSNESEAEFSVRLHQISRYLLCDCGRQRFRYDNRGRTLHTGVRYYYFGVANQLRKLFANPTWAKHFQQNTDQMYYFASPEYHRLCRKLQQLGIPPSQCVFIDIAHDGFMPFKATSSRHSWGVWLRVKNVDPSIHFRYFNVREVALWPQATKPRMDGVVDKVNVTLGFRQIVDELCNLCVAGQPLQVWDAHVQGLRDIYVILASMMQDTPGRQKVMGGGGVQAYFSCQWCVMQSVPVTKEQMAHFRANKRQRAGQLPANKRPRPPHSVVRASFSVMHEVDAQEDEAYLSAEEPEHAPEPGQTAVTGRATRYPVGYVRRVHISRYRLSGKLRGFTEQHQALGVRVGDPCIKLSNAQQLYRMRRAAQEDGTDALQAYGCRQVCDFLRLGYVSYNDLFVLPTYHMLLYGVLRTFWRYALNADNRMITRADLTIMAQREQGVITVSDIPERYDGIKRGMARWQLKHWMYWADVWFYLVCLGVTFHGSLPSDADRVQPPHGVAAATTFTHLVHQMHESVLWFVRPQHKVTEALVRKHHYILHHFAQAVEVTCGPGQQTTTNLHYAVCRLGDQCLCRGHSGHEGELWVERCIGVMNQVIGSAHTGFPEQTLVKRLLLDDAIVEQFRLHNREGNDVDSIALQRDKRVAVNAVQQFGTDDVWFIGSVYWPQFARFDGQLSTINIIQKALCHRFVNVLTRQQGQLLSASHVQFYPRAEIGGAVVIHAFQGSLESVSESHWVLILWKGGRGHSPIPTIARIETFIKFTDKGMQELQLGAVPFLAIVQLFKCQEVQEHERILYRTQAGVYDETSVPGLDGLRAIQVQQIEAKVHRFVDTAQESRQTAAYSYYTTYQCTSMT